uniref:PLAT domain-containing protein n=1 Tax=Chenopodium quinoa TaxID=63459 RepID=A0A803LVV2_CHEQI
MSACGKKARASQNQFHRSDSNSFANQQADYEDEHGQKMSLLALWIKTHMGKDRSFLSNIVTEDFVDDVKAKVEELRMMYPKMSEQELEDEAFQKTMYRDEIPDRPVGHGLGVKKGDIYRVRSVLRKEGYGKVHRRTIVMDSVKEEVTALHKKNDTLSQENEKLKDQVGHNNFLLKVLVGQFSHIVGAIRQGNTSPSLLNKTSEFLEMANYQVMVVSGEGSGQQSTVVVTL